MEARKSDDGALHLLLVVDTNVAPHPDADQRDEGEAGRRDALTELTIAIGLDDGIASG